MTVIDLKTRKPLERVETDENSSIVQYLNFWKNLAKERKVKGVMIMTIDADGGCAWDARAEDEVQLLRMQSCIKKLDNLLDSLIWPDEYEEDEVAGTED